MPGSWPWWTSPRGRTGAVAQPAPPDHSSFRIDLLGWLLIILGVLLLILILIIWGIYRLATRGRRRRRRAEAAAAGGRA